MCIRDRDYTADTLVILMGIGNIKENTSEIMKYRSGDTPVSYTHLICSNTSK